MEKHFLATLSNDSTHLHGVQFICSFLNISENRVTLFHICKNSNISKSLTSSWDNPNDASSASIPPEVKRSIEKAQRLLASRKVPVDRIITKTVSERYGKVRDILTESAKGHYDAIVLGKRASYALQWMFDRPADETFQTMIKENLCLSPLWICPDIEPERKDVLLCVDGSENGYRAVDHVGYILSDQKQHNVKLFYIEEHNGDRDSEVFEKARALLLSHKVNAQNITSSTGSGFSVPGVILSEANKGKYAAVAMGMGGKIDKNANSRVVGPTAVKLINKLEKTAIWCCP
jgi:nucleotide-binding universal stress UspA family protein